MSSVANKVVIGFGLVALLCTVGIATEAKKKPKSLLTMYGEWQYPNAEFNGAEMSDGGMAGIASSHCKSVMTTKDAFEKVTAFYEKLLELEKRKEADARFPQAVLVQSDSKERDCKVRVFLVNAKETSTSIVVSRGKDEAQTHIAWSHFVRLYQ